MPYDLPISETHEGYDLCVTQSPLADALVSRMLTLLGHKGPLWLTDIEARYRADAPDICATAWLGDEAVGHIWIGLDRACPQLGVFGHVYTDPAHRGHGLASRLTALSIAAAQAAGGRFLELGVSNEQAMRIYSRYGFAPLLTAPDGNGQTMLFGGDVRTAIDALYPADAALRIVPYSRDYYAATTFLLNLLPGEGKLPGLGISDGRNAEAKLLEYEQNRAALPDLDLAVNPATGVVYGARTRLEGHSHVIGWPTALLVLG